MKANVSLLTPGAISLFIVAMLVSACGGQVGVNKPTVTTAVKPLSIVTTVVRVFNSQHFSDIYGSLPVPAPCWTVSPSPLPIIVFEGDPKITFKYDTTCSHHSIVMSYGTDPSFTCTFKVGYHSDTSTFSYVVGNTGDTTCSATPAPPSSDYDELLTYSFYGQIRTKAP
jgi:hypothetical protein